MLEQPRLLLRQCDGPSRTPPEPATIFAVLEPASAMPLGQVARRSRVRFFGLRWFLPEVVEVREGEDGSLVFTVRHAWAAAPRWQVRDAEENPIGAVRTLGFHRPAGMNPTGPRQSWLEDRFGQVFASLDWVAPESAWRFRAWDGTELGSLVGGEAGTVVSFAPSVQSQPFTKMLLLAAAVVLCP